jgi:hypothetical protein
MIKVTISFFSGLHVVVLGLMCVVMPMGCGPHDETRTWNESDLIKIYKVSYSRPTLKVIQLLDASVRVLDGTIPDKIERTGDGSYYGYARRYAVSSSGDVCLGSVDVRMSDGNAEIVFTLYPVIESGPRSGQMVSSNDIRDVVFQWETEAKMVLSLIQKN